MLSKLQLKKTFVLKFFALTVLFIVFVNCTDSKEDAFAFQSFPDKNTMGLWLFDETEYNYTTLSDAGRFYYDLRLMPGGHLEPGKYGNSLVVDNDSGYAVSYAGFAGKTVNNHIRRPDGVISGLWGPTEGPEKILESLRSEKWTFELWIRLDDLDDEVTIIDLGQSYDPGFTIRLLPDGTIILTSAYSGIKITSTLEVSPDDIEKWHHLAICQNTSEIMLFLNGKMQSASQTTSTKKQSLPDFQKPEDREHEHRNFDSLTYDERRKNRFNLSIGQSRNGQSMMSGALDEIRFSDIARYSENFTPPSSFARTKISQRTRSTENVDKKSLALLFSNNRSDNTIPFGLRKYIFIDDAIMDSSSGVAIRMNQPTDRQKINFKPEKSAWRPTVVDIDNKVYLYIPEGYDSEHGRTFLYTSEDGVHFSEHNKSPVITDLPLYGTFFEDKNPNILPEEKYKLTSWIGNRGIHLFFSPDGVHWRRNETLILPLVSGGSAESYYDNQTGSYKLLIRRDTSFKTETCPGGARQCIYFETIEPGKTWPFKRLESPYYEGWTLPAVTCEGPVVFDETESGQAYRSRAIKYPWAPDVYFAFVWRYPSDQGDDPARHVDLGVSRDGINWNFFEPEQGWYIPLSNDPDPEQISIYGLIRRGNEIWQYTNHGGPHGGSPPRTYYRWKQRLDGFTSLDGSGTAVTKPLRFTGNEVKLTVNSSGSLKVAILDEGFNEYPEFSLSTCDIIQDSVSQVVTWSGKSDLSNLSGRVLRLKFELSDTKLFAFELQN